MSKGKPSSFLWIYGVLAVLAVIGAAVGWGLFDKGQTAHDLALAELGRNLLGISVIAIVAILAALPIALNQEQSAKADLDYHTQLLGGLNEQLQQVCLLLNLEAENQLISDRTKAVAFREKDHDTIRRAVQEEIARQDWEAALALANDMDSVFGYKSEADRFRQEISSKRQDSVQKQITEQMAIVDRYTNAEAWAQALQEAQRIIALHPNDERLMHLPQEIEARRQACKKKLMGTWNEAVERHDVDGSIEILKHLDMYLTPAEAEGMQEKARSVFKEKIGLLRMQFTMAVQDKRWAEAIRLGDSIVAEFPNTRMAQEVRDMMEMLRQRAGDGNVAKV